MHGRNKTSNPKSSSKYFINFDDTIIETTVTSKASITNTWVQDVIRTYQVKPTVVGLDIEWRPNFTRSSDNKAATLQLCIDDKCLIVQLFYMGNIPQPLKDFLSDSNFTFVGVEVDKDISKLENDYGLECSNTSDIREVAKLHFPGRFRKPGLKELAVEICGILMEKPKHVTMSNWQARVLSDSQVRYACIDAYVSYKIGHSLLQD